MHDHQVTSMIFFRHFRDQLEKDFETSGSSFNDVRLDTPPDSDSENSEYLNQLLDEGMDDGVNEGDEGKVRLEDDFEAPVAAAGYDLLNSSKLLLKPLASLTASSLPSTSKSSMPLFLLPASPSPSASSSLKRTSTQSIDSLINDVSSKRLHDSINVIRTDESRSKVNVRLPVETLAVVNKLPQKLFHGNDSKLLEVVKVNMDGTSYNLPITSLPRALMVMSSNLSLEMNGNRERNKL